MFKGGGYGYSESLQDSRIQGEKDVFWLNDDLVVEAVVEDLVALVTEDALEVIQRDVALPLYVDRLEEEID